MPSQIVLLSQAQDSMFKAGRDHFVRAATYWAGESGHPGERTTAYLLLDMPVQEQSIIHLQACLCSQGQILEGSKLLTD